MKSIAATLRRLSLALLTVIVIFGSFAVFTPTASAETYTIKLGTDRGLLQFEPKKLTVKAGDTIEWKNNKVPPHNVVFDAKKNPTKNAALAKSLSHKKLLMSPGQKVTTVIPADAAPGSYTFYCEPHRGAGMVGKIIVEG
ncbi:plastocyanin [Aphanizomenon flos-aquae NRERC-008]|jgi:plastocyanin|uniref:Plastocyanin n=1 Tax=Aphanizomenon flos-aquae FACHB-1249 TaxID=2692889 RepID=A0ABR8IMX4_APHFL|nr:MULTISPECIES: plastocyanin [Aphanizomenon]OBQ19985.1 MAG: plastocyanin [Anabaena sp. WA113]MBD2392137.1 plastocyanin [Aphanizomenon flos-aquae FACHB-1171]MBD2557991.1 plastocyanin [Aphanizomenon flos-aquae FACHB-1290]MBD2630189.1 plastocyanin [Aphanizomenon sp. FACHB-1399]MBD2641297.1 plastocyanin [Aphanizomenon sp. FACHB-1401]